MDFGILRDVANAQHTEMVRQAERAEQLRRSSRVTGLPAVLRGLVLIFG